MLEIWVEDSTNGYRFFKLFNKFVLNNTFKIIPHDGVGDKSPTLTKYGGIFHHLKNDTTNNKLILLVIDKALDKQETKEQYKIIQDRIKSNKNIYLIEQHSFEKCILSYTNKNIIIGSRDTRKLNIADEFVKLCNNNQYDPKYMSSTFKIYLKEHKGKIHSENIGKSILSDLTSISIRVNNKDISPCIISKGKLGLCWCKDCCALKLSSNQKRCYINKVISIKEKINDIYNCSDYSNIYKQILDALEKHLSSLYHGNSFYDDKYKQKYNDMNRRNKYTDIVDYLRLTESNYWNFERLYKYIKGVKY